MGKIRSGILGPVSGKIGEVVGASWKGVNYLRSYVIPGNPNTASQQAERALFANIVSLAHALLGPVLQVYWDPFLRKISGWSHFIGVSRGLVTTVDDFSAVQICQGTLEGDLITSCAYGSPSVDITFAGVVHGNGAPTDAACLFVYDRVNKVGFFDNSATRSLTAATCTVGAGRVAANMDAWLFFADDATSPTKVSYSDYSVVS